MEDEDEDVIYVNTGLYSYLMEAGYSNFEVVDFKQNHKSTTVNSKPDIKNRTDSRARNFNRFFKRFGDCSHQISKILESTLLYEDDIRTIQTFTFEFNIVPEKSLLRRLLVNDIFSKITIITASFISCALHYRFQRSQYSSLFLIPVTGFCIKYLYDEYNNILYKKHIELLLQILKLYSSLLHKSIQYVQESEVMVTNNPLIRNKIAAITKLIDGNVSEKLMKNDTNWHMMVGFRKTIMSSVYEMIDLLRTGVLHLINTFPLESTVDQLSYYLSYLNNEDMGIQNYNHQQISANILQKFKYIYLLIQSEFLRRLCLCFYPTLWKQNPINAMNDLFRIVKDVSRRGKFNYERLDKEFKLYFIFGGVDNNKKREVVNNESNWELKDIYSRTRSLSNYLQLLLTHSRSLEELLEHSYSQETESIFLKIDENLLFLLDHYDKCKYVIDDLQTYVASLKPKQNENESDTLLSSVNDMQFNKKKETGILICGSDFTPQWPDEVYLGVSSKTTSSGDFAGDFCFDTNIMYTKQLIEELKIALKNKQVERKKREKMALRNKQMIDLSSESEDEIIIKNHGKKKIISYLRNSSSEDESIEINIHKKQNVKNASPMSSEVNLVTDMTEKPDRGHSNFKPPALGGDTLARQIANISVEWGLNHEEHFYDSEDDIDE